MKTAKGQHRHSESKEHSEQHGVLSSVRRPYQDPISLVLTMEVDCFYSLILCI